MNNNGSMDNIISGVVYIFIFLIVFFVTMSIWGPFTSIYLYPLLNNGAAFGSMGGLTVTLMQFIPPVCVAMLFLAFIRHIQTGVQQQYGSYQ